MNTAIIYYSKTVFTKRYAEWLTEEVAADLICFDDAWKTDWNFRKQKIYLSE